MTEESTPSGTVHIRVRFRCPTCESDTAIASTWCSRCWVERGEWVKVERYQGVIDHGA